MGMQTDQASTLFRQDDLTTAMLGSLGRRWCGDLFEQLLNPLVLSVVHDPNDYEVRRSDVHLYQAVLCWSGVGCGC